ncbi:MAG: DUF2497 domain-containing protein, partial [Geminicoccaceae bacterium]
MEEILSSIRRIIADEEADRADGADDDDLGAAELQDEASEQDLEDFDQAADEDDPEDVLELTKVVREGGEVVELRGDGAGEPEPAVQHQDEPEPGSAEEEAGRADLSTVADDAAEEEPIAMTEDHSKREDETVHATKQTDADELVSITAASTATGALAKLSQAFQRTPTEVSMADGDGRTVEQFIEDLVRPMLKDWLDEHMPPLVERLVQREIQKMARRAEV